MTQELHDEQSLSAEDLENIDRVCLDFEQVFRAGRTPRLEQYLARVPGRLQRAAFVYLLRVEAELLTGAGQPPSADEYRARFPKYVDLIGPAVEQCDDLQVALEVIIGPHQGRRFEFGKHDSFMVGRAPFAHFRLKKDPSVSRVHFLVEVNPPHCRLVDLCSLNGTRVNGRRVEWTDLCDGDLVQGGNTVIRVGIRMPTVAPPSTVSLAGPPPVREPSPDLPPGSAAEEAPLPRFPGYQVIETLGRGGMGAVYLAERTGDGLRVAIKVIRPSCTPSEQEVQRFLREAQILCALRHPNIVGFHQLGRQDDLLYIVMDFVAGNNVKQLVRRHGRLAIGHAVRLMCQVLDALDYAHQRGYVHRDVKPSNVLISANREREECRLADFGLARVYFDSRMSGLTLLGDVGGTLPFMAPEQITDFRGARPAADQYGAAATLYYMCTGELMHSVARNQNGEQIMKILLTEPIPIRQKRPDVPVGLAKVIHKALAKDPRRRFPDVAAFHDELIAHADV